MSASCEMQASPSALSAVLGNTGARWCGSSFPHCYTDMLFLAASGKHVLAAYPLPPPPPHRRRCEAEASQQLSPAMSFTSAQMEYWQRGGTGVCGAAQQRPRRLCDRRTYFIYVGLRCAAAAAAVFFFKKKGRTHRDHLFLSADRSAAHDPIRRGGCRWWRPGWRTICSLAVQGWSG